MRKRLFKLVPERVKFDEFWIEIRKRNRWLILLRYGAAAMLITLILGIYLFENLFRGFALNTLPLWIIAVSILIYNIIFHRIWFGMKPFNQNQKQGFHCLHFSLLQISVDFFSLMLFIYYTGGIESPIYAFFIFHVIIGSLLLPGAFISLIVTITIAITFAGSLLEFYGNIPHHSVQGLLSVPLYNNISYLIIFFSFFSVTIYLSIYLANSIAKQLYRREKALTKAYKDLEDAEKTKSRYVISVVHDLKTPIAAAMTYLNMMSDGTLGQVSKEQQRPLERSRVRLSQAINVINDILQVSLLKLQSGKETITDVNLIKLFDDIYSDMKVLFRSKGIQYSFLADSKEDIMIKGDPKILKLALSNLLSNACKYTDIGGKVEIKLEDSKESVEISVADNGIGIPDKEKDKIFNDFYRSSLSKQMGIEGTGLGMSIVKQFVDNFHGDISINSPSYLETGDTKPGTQFLIKIPKNYSVLQ